MMHKQSGRAMPMTGGGAVLRERQEVDGQEWTRMQDLGRGEASGSVNSTTFPAASYLRSNRCSPRGQRCRRSGPVGPASFHLHRSTVWVSLSLLRIPHTSLSPPQGNPCEEPYQGKLRGSSQSVGSVCRTPDVKGNKWGEC